MESWLTDLGTSKTTHLVGRILSSLVRLQGWTFHIFKSADYYRATLYDGHWFSTQINERFLTELQMHTSNSSYFQIPSPLPNSATMYLSYVGSPLIPLHFLKGPYLTILIVLSFLDFSILL